MKTQTIARPAGEGKAFFGLQVELPVPPQRRGRFYLATDIAAHASAHMAAWNDLESRLTKALEDWEHDGTIEMVRFIDAETGASVLCARVLCKVGAA